MKQLNLKFFVLTLTLTSFAQVDLAHSQISCSTTQSCSVANMPMIDQNDPYFFSNWGNVSGSSTTTMLCAPTSVAIALSALTDVGQGVDAGTVMSQFKTLNHLQRTEYMAQLIGTTRTGGSYWSNTGNVYTARAPEFAPLFTSTWTKTSTTVAVNAAQMLTDFKAGKVPTVHHGHFDVACVNLLSGESRCTYTRNGGHAMAVQAVNGSQVTFNDPWYAVLRNFVVALLPSKLSTGQPLSHVLPSNFSTATAHQFKWSQTYAALLEGIVSVGGSAHLAAAPAPAPTPTPTPDTTAPQTSVTSPIQGGRVAVYSTVTIAASATDNIQVSKVEFYINGTLKCTDTVAPYSCAWKVPRYKGRTYQLTTRAFDNAGLSSTSAAVSVTSY